MVLVLGIAGAGVLYWIRTRNQDAGEDPMLEGYSNPSARQMGVLYGKMGLMISDLTDDLKRPGVQAILIAAVSVVVALACFYLARRPDDGPTRC